MRKKIPAALRREIIERARGFCEYCYANSEFSDSPFDVEHIVPVSQNGATESGNLALSCHGCNLYKSNRITALDVAGKKIVEIYNPRIGSWNKHFLWSEDFTIIIGLTPVGRATVEALKLNRKGLINQRKSLRFSGEHPPGKFL